MSDLKLGIQMWSIHDICVQEGMASAIKKVKEMGYNGFEYALGDSITLKERCNTDAEEAVKILREYDVKALGAHIPFEPMLIDPKPVLEECLKLEIPYAAVGPVFWGDRATYAEQKETYVRLKDIAILFHKNGIQLQVHCSAFGYLKDYKGRYVVEGMLEEAGLENLQPEFDTAWMICGGVDPVEMLKKYEGHVDILHFKDFHPLQEEYSYLMVRHNTICEQQHDGCAVGENGVQDLESIVKAAGTYGTKWLITELWNEKDSLRNARVSAENLSKYMK